MTKIIFLDVDGTLVDYSNTLPATAVAAIRAARGHGHRVYLSTGRSRAEVYPELWAIGVDGLVGANGGYVESAGEVIFHRGLSAGQTREIVDWLHSRGCEFYLESNSGLYASEHFEEAGKPVMAKYTAGRGRAVMSTREAFPDMIWGAGLYRGDVNKISYILNTYAEFEATRDRFPELKSNTWGGFGAEALFGDLGVGGITKREAVDVVLAHHGADRADTIAFGDAHVDIPLFAACAVGVAMGEAAEDLKEVADLVTGDVLDDGLAGAFIELGLITGAELAAELQTVSGERN